MTPFPVKNPVVRDGPYHDVSAESRTITCASFKTGNQRMAHLQEGGKRMPRPYEEFNRRSTYVSPGNQFSRNVH